MKNSRQNNTVTRKKSKKVKRLAWRIALVTVFALQAVAFAVTGARAMTQTLQKDPAIVIAAFGTTTKAGVTYEYFDALLKNKLPAQYKNYRIVWAFTSEIVRERVNKKFAEQGVARRYRSLAQTLADLEDEGYRKVVVQPLHIFPGQEYDDVLKVVAAFRTLGLRIELGGSLLHKWKWMFEAVSALQNEFLAPDEGCNILVTHGSPLTFPGSNSAYIGLDRYVRHKYGNVFVGSVEGVLTREQALDLARAYPKKRVRFIPFLYVAGEHIMKDIMGRKIDDEGRSSWAMEMQQAGFAVDTVYTTYQGKK